MESDGRTICFSQRHRAHRANNIIFRAFRVFRGQNNDANNQEAFA
jgi:hypothetical protein